MKANYDIEYLDENGECQNLQVEFEGFPEWQDDSFDYAGTHCTGGRSGTHCTPAYPSMQDSEILWNANNHTPEESKIISNWLLVDKNYEELQDHFCNLLKNN